jgi:alanine racemase
MLSLTLAVPDQEQRSKSGTMNTTIMCTRPVWAEISRQALLSNFRLLRDRAGASIDLLAVVKANAYGHGILECAPLLAGPSTVDRPEWIGVTCVEEGIRVRPTCPDVRILVMSGLWRGEAEAAIEHRLTPLVWEAFHFDELESTAQRLGLAPQSLPVHLEIDTGMSRQGVRVVEANPSGTAALAALLKHFSAHSALRLEGVMTHFSAPEMLEERTSSNQIARLAAALDVVKAHGLRPAWVHAGNSAILLAQKVTPPLTSLANKMGARLMLRPGLTLYGYPPRFSPGQTATSFAKELLGYRPVLEWKTRITSLRTIEAGDGAGYNATYRASRESRLALLPLGYADGFNRLLSNRGSVLVRGQRVPIAGRVSMDQTIIDVTHVPSAAIGDEVVLLGRQGDASISAYDLADQIGSIPFEVLCNINTRVPRILVD